MSRPLFALLLTLIIAPQISACRILVVVPEGGKVITRSGAIQCAATQSCPIDVDDLLFDETFVAVPDAGYVFTGWRKDQWYFCGGKRTVCSLATHFMGKNSTLRSVLSSQQVFFLSPRFARGVESNIGHWQGEWVSSNTQSAGIVSLGLKSLSNNRIQITLELEGGLREVMGSPLLRLSASRRPNGNITFKGDADVSGIPSKITFNLDQAGKLLLSTSTMAPTEFKSIDIEGTLRGAVGFFRYSVKLSATSSSQGTITIFKR